MAAFKLKMDPLARENKQLLVEIKTRQAKVNGVIYHMANHEEGMMETFDENGDFLGSRRLRPDEKQGSVFALPKAVNQ